MQISIRDEEAADIDAIALLIAEAFRDAPYASHTEQFIVDALRDAGALTLSLVADSEGRVVGQVAVSPMRISDGSQGWYGLGPIAVAPSHQRVGIGSRLMQAALERLRELGAAGCVLLGDPRYYQRFGFQAMPGLTLPGVPPEYFMALAFDDSRPEGTAAYHAAFDAKS